MSKKSELPQSRRHIMIFDEDWAFLDTHYGEAIGTGTAIKKIVHAKVRALRASIEGKAQ